jgi:hypothetical protein
VGIEEADLGRQNASNESGSVESEEESNADVGGRKRPFPNPDSSSNNTTSSDNALISKSSTILNSSNPPSKRFMHLSRPIASMKGHTAFLTFAVNSVRSSSITSTSK